MNTFLNLISKTCTQVVNWFDNSLQQLINTVTNVANVAIRVLMAYALYALFVQELIVKIVEAF